MGDKHTSENVILELSSDREKFYTFMRIMPETADDLPEFVRDRMTKEALIL
jgi:hypothetical protein